MKLLNHQACTWQILKLLKSNEDWRIKSSTHLICQVKSTTRWSSPHGTGTRSGGYTGEQGARRCFSVKENQNKWFFKKYIIIIYPFPIKDWSQHRDKPGDGGSSACHPHARAHSPTSRHARCSRFWWARMFSILTGGVTGTGSLTHDFRCSLSSGATNSPQCWINTWSRVCHVQYYLQYFKIIN